MLTVIEPSKNVPVVAQADICVLGGSCTGVFAAVRAARLGARVALVEKQNAFGGVAASAMVCVWHSLLDTEFKNPIIAGLTAETIDRLRRHSAINGWRENSAISFVLNTEELKIELDELVTENGICPFLHTAFCGPYVEDGTLKGVFVENKSGRGIILARYFIDATGDGDLCHRLGLSAYTRPVLQPPSPTARLYGFNGSGVDLGALIHQHGAEFGLPDDSGWNLPTPDMPEISFHSDTHIFHVDCANADDLTRAEMEGRRNIRAVLDLLRAYGPKGRTYALAALPSYIGIRETRHIQGRYCLTMDDVLFGRPFEDAVANGSYRVDVHSADRPGVLFRYLNGEEVYERLGFPLERGRWRDDGGPYPTYYQIPYRCLIPADRRYGNVIAAGRMIDADEGAFGAVRVMVNTNQMGEAAGVAAFLALEEGLPFDGVSVDRLRKTLARGDSIIL